MQAAGSFGLNWRGNCGIILVQLRDGGDSISHQGLDCVKIIWDRQPASENKRVFCEMGVTNG